MGDEEIIGTLRIWLEFLFEHDDAVGMDMAVEVENLNISENHENIENRVNEDDDNMEYDDYDSDSANDNIRDRAAADPGIDTNAEGDRDAVDEDDSSSVMLSSSTSTSEGDVIDYDDSTSDESESDDGSESNDESESDDSGIDLPDSDHNNAERSARIKQVEHADASDENSDEDQQPASSWKVSRKHKRSPAKHTGAGRDSEEDLQPGPSRKRRRKMARDGDSEDDSLHGLPLKIVREMSAGPGKHSGATSYNSEEDALPGPSRRMEDNSKDERSNKYLKPCCEDSDSDAFFVDETEGISQKEDKKDKADED